MDETRVHWVIGLAFTYNWLWPSSTWPFTYSYSLIATCCHIVSSLASPAPYPSRLPGPVLSPPSFHQHSLLPLDSLKLKLCSPLYFVLLYWLSCAFISTVLVTYPVLFQIQTTDFYCVAYLLSSTIQSFYSCKICNKQVKHKNFLFFLQWSLLDIATMINGLRVQCQGSAGYSSRSRSVLRYGAGEGVNGLQLQWGHRICVPLRSMLHSSAVVISVNGWCSCVGGAMHFPILGVNTYPNK